MKKIIFIAVVFLVNFSHLIIAQSTGADRQGGKTSTIGHVYGKIIDSKTKVSVPFASVAIFKVDSLIGGSFAGNNGEFSIENLPFGTFNLKITFIGFKQYLQVISITPQNQEQDLGNIKIEMEEAVLNTVEVTSEESASEINIDRRVFNVDKDLTIKGGTATDVMKNIPSVTLDNNGNAQLRQNAAIVYIDGRPTTLTLDQIPSDQIEKVEVITNPSAKFEASATGGIINLVMKNNAKPGYNGIITGGIGTNDHYNGMATLNFKEKPFGLQLSYNYNTFQNPVKGFTNRTDLLNDAAAGYYNANANSTFRNTMQMGSVNVDYYLNNRNTLSLSGNIVTGDFINKEDQIFNSLNTSGKILNNGSRIANTATHFENYGAKLHYRKTFPKKNKELTADLNYSATNLNSSGTYVTKAGMSDSTLAPTNPELQNNVGHNVNQVYTFQADYVNPINDSTKFECGIRSNYKPSVQSLDVNVFNYTSNEYVPDQYLTSHYKIQDLVNAAYINYTTRIKKVNLALGLRFEDSYYRGKVTNKNDSSFLYSYPGGIKNLMNAIFPSIFITRKLNEKREIQFNISRKINRPNYRQLMPMINASDPRNYSIGNPDLTPEFITMAEFNVNQALSKGTLFLTLFYRNTQNPLTNYVYTSPADSSVLINTFINGKQSNTYGLDNTFKYNLFKGFEVTFNLNLFYSFINAEFKGRNVSNQGFYYTGKLDLVYHLPQNFSIQLSGNYESPKVIPQGKARELYFADCGISKDIKKFITLTASVSDIFDSKGRGMYYATDQYTQDTWNRRESRYVKFTVMIRFGKADASLFKKRSQSQQQNDAGNNDF
jgi:iron complex outermembrane receptor protein